MQKNSNFFKDTPEIEIFEGKKTENFENAIKEHS